MGMPSGTALYYDKLDQQKMDVESIAASEAIIAEKAPAAIHALQQMGATEDIYEALGLTNYVREHQNV